MLHLPIDRIPNTHALRACIERASHEAVALAGGDVVFLDEGISDRHGSSCHVLILVKEITVDVPGIVGERIVGSGDFLEDWMIIY